MIAATAALDRAEEFARLVEAAGGEFRAFPLVEVVPVRDPARWAIASERFDGVVFTSRNAVDAYVRALAPRTLRDACVGRFVAAVGAATAAELAQHGLVVDVVPERADANSLADALRERVAGKRILLPLSARADASLETSLRAAGGEVVRIEAYDVVAVPQAHVEQLELALALGTIDVVTFLAGSAVDAMSERIGPARSKACLECSRVVTLGRSATAALARIGVTPFAVSPETTLASVARIACDAGRQRKRTV